MVRTLRALWLALVLGSSPCLLAPAHAADYADQIKRLVRDAHVERALEVAVKWTEEEPDDRDALITCGDLAMRFGDFETAIACYESALFMAETPRVAVKLGDALRESGATDAALLMYARALEIDGASVAPHVGIARVRMLTADTRLEARLSLEAAAALAPESADVETARAELQLLSGSTGTALKLLQQVVADSPDHSRARLLLGEVLARRGDERAAKTQWQRYMRLEPDSPKAWLLAHNLFPIAQTTHQLRGSYFAFSPDGGQIAYVGAGATAMNQVLLTSLDALLEPTVVCEFKGRPSGIAWSRDGKRLACRTYARLEEDGRKVTRYSLWTVGVDGSELREIYSDRYVGTPAWMPDGKRICFDASIPRKGRGLLTIRDAVGAEATQFLFPPRGHAIVGVTWHPTTEAFLTSSVVYQPERAWKLTVYPEGRFNKSVTVATSEEGIYVPSFAPAGDAVVFLRPNQQRTYNIYAAGTDARKPRQCLLLRGDFYAASASFAPDGQTMLVYARPGVTLITLTGVNPQ